MSSDSEDDYESARFTDSDSFLRATAPIPRLCTETPRPEFIFRGQAEASKPLIPSALRRDDTTGRTRAMSLLDTYVLRGQAEEQVWAEFHVLKMFVDSCDRAVIPLPGDGYDFRKEWMDDQTGHVQRAYRDPSLWPFPRCSGLGFRAALRHPDAAAGLDPKRHRCGLLRRVRRDRKGNFGGRSGGVGFEYRTHAPVPTGRVGADAGCQQRQAGAQRGLFTVVRDDVSRGRAADARSLPAALASRNADITKPKPLWKLTLPQSEASRLLYLCHLNGVDAASVYPGLRAQRGRRWNALPGAGAIRKRGSARPPDDHASLYDGIKSQRTRGHTVNQAHRMIGTDDRQPSGARPIGGLLNTDRPDHCPV